MRISLHNVRMWQNHFHWGGGGWGNLNNCQRSKTLFIRTKHNLQIFGVILFIKLQNNTQATVKLWKTMKKHVFGWASIIHLSVIVTILSIYFYWIKLILMFIFWCFACWLLILHKHFIFIHCSASFTWVPKGLGVAYAAHRVWHSFVKITCERSESARERRTALYKSDQ